MNQLRQLEILRKRVAPFGTHADNEATLFAELVRAICSQQLSLKAAETIHKRVCALFPNATPVPEIVSKLSVLQLRAAGLSQAKLLALRDLADKTVSGIVPTDLEAKSLSDDDLIRRLTLVRGIGRWTVEMILIFRYLRLDVWPADDLGVQKGFRLLFPSIKFTSARELAGAADFYRGKRSELAWFCWRAIEEQKLQTLRQIPFELFGRRMQLWLRGERVLRIDFTRRETPPALLWPGDLVRAPQLSTVWKKKILHALRFGLSELPVEIVGTPFQQQVWTAIAAIPHGETRTYLELATEVGRPKAVRAVAQACGANQLPLIIPCHRVVATSGIGGFSGGVELKKKILAAEKAGLRISND